MNQDLVMLRHILDLFLNSRMAEAEAILAKGVVPVGEGLPIPGATGAGAKTTTTASEKATEATANSNNNKDDDASSVTSSSAPSTAPSSANKDEKSEKKSASQSSSTGSSKKGGPKEVRSMYFELAKGIIQGLRALVTFDPFEIEAGMKAFEKAIKTADKQRKGSMLGLGSVKAVGSFVVGTIGAGSFKGMTRVQKHAVSLQKVIYFMILDSLLRINANQPVYLYGGHIGTYLCRVDDSAFVAECPVPSRCLDGCRGVHQPPPCFHHHPRLEVVHGLCRIGPQERQEH